MLSYERQLVRHHNDRGPRVSPMSLAHQAARRTCLETTLVVSVPFRDEGSLFVELDLDDPVGGMRVACQPSAPSARRLSLAWAQVSEDGIRIEDSDSQM